MPAFICKINIPMVLSLAFLLGLWKILSLWVGASIIIPSPEETFNACFLLLGRSDFYTDVWHTVARSLTGFFIALALALLMGITAGTYQVVYILFKPLVSITKATPTMSVILLALIWLHTEIAPILVGFLVIFPLLYSNIVEGIKSVDPKLLEMASMYQVKKKRMITELYLPSLSSHLTTAAATALGLNLKVIIAAEVLSQPRNCIGTSLQMEQINLNTAGVFAWTIIAILISSFFDYSLTLLRKRVEKWK